MIFSIMNINLNRLIIYINYEWLRGWKKIKEYLK